MVTNINNLHWNLVCLCNLQTIKMALLISKKGEGDDTTEKGLLMIFQNMFCHVYLYLIECSIAVKNKEKHEL